MAERLRKRILRWGNSYGIRLTRAEAERLGLREGADVDVEVRPGRPEVDWGAVGTFRWGATASQDIDELLYEASR